MVFSTPVFLFLFLPLFFIIYYALPQRWKLSWILAGSWAFYGFWRLDFLLLMIAVSVANWLAAHYIQRFRLAGRSQPQLSGLLFVAVFLNLLVLAYFKYFNFGLDALNSLLALIALGPLRGWRIILPVGISFYIFQAMSYVIDVYRKDAPAARNPLDMFAYLALFPQLIAGPILRYKDVAYQLERPRISQSMVAYGLQRFFTGFCRKVLIADTVALVADAAFGLAAPSGADAWLGVIAYAVQLYFDFAAYSDMAIGLGAMMGFSFMENFDTPYRAFSITDFWRRWHISLSTWLRDYLYVPLGGNRHGAARTYVNLFLVMALGGLWHGASWNFVLWGCWHGLWLALERRFNAGSIRKGQKPAFWLRLPRYLGTQAIVLVGWVLFRSINLPAAGSMLAAMAGANGWQFSPGLLWQAGSLEYFILATGLVILALEPRIAAYRRPLQPQSLSTTVLGRSASDNLIATVPMATGQPGPDRSAAAFRLGFFMRWSGLAALALFAVLKLVAAGYSPFLYFQF
ncbi:MAG: MBOAT family protein [Spirochaetes bacterium]|nr:MBOAT family protein [Spirochaetota bacterium]MBU0956325.1 MBOAT family protein [Spirochaetota bacterium]